MPVMIATAEVARRCMSPDFALQRSQIADGDPESQVNVKSAGDHAEVANQSSIAIKWSAVSGGGMLPASNFAFLSVHDAQLVRLGAPADPYGSSAGG
jgi:hypothetical protein